MNSKSKLKYEPYLKQRFGSLTILELVYDIEANGRSRYKYKCECDCGNIKSIPCWYILEKGTKSCGCSKFKTKIDYSKNIKKRFGKLIILELKRMKLNNDTQKKLYYKIKCDCGTIKYQQVHSFHKYKYKSCGCFQVSESIDKYSNMIGDIINDLTIIEYIYNPEEEQFYKHQFKCKCKCGNDQYVISCERLLSNDNKNCNLCLRNKAQNSYYDLLEYCEWYNLKLISKFTSKSSPRISSNGKTSTVYNKLKFECLNCKTKFYKTLSPDSTLLCPTCNDKFPSSMERTMSKFLQDNNLDYTKEKILSESNIQHYVEIDFLINNIGIELHGLHTHATTIKDYDNYFLKSKPKNYHLNKLNSAVKNDIDLIQFWNIELLQKPDIVKSIIRNKLNLTKYKEYARKCYIKEIDKYTSDEFLNRHHIQGKVNNDSIRIGLFYNGNDKLISVMTFGKSRFSRAEYEMYRFATHIDCQVVGGASKLFKYFVRTYNPKNIISYSDRRLFDNGKLYDVLGFEFLHFSSPNYWYFKRYSHEVNIKLLHRINFQKHKLSKILKDFDPDKTEFENMEDNNYLKVYDCGNKVYLWNK